MNKIIPALILTLVSFFALLPTSIFAVTVLTHPDRETYVNEFMHNRPMADGPGLWVRSEVGKDSATLIKFFTADIPANAKITSAKVELWQGQYSGAQSADLYINRIRDDWREEDVTWDNKPRVGENYGYTTTDTTNGFKAFYITQLVQRWVNGEYPNHGIYIWDGGINRDFSRTFASSNFETRENRPKITIVYTVPGASPTPRVFSNVNIVGGNVGLVNPTIGPVGVIPGGVVNNGADVAKPVISDIKVIDITSSQAKISWKTNKNSSSWVFYGNSNDGTDRFDMQTGQNDLVTSHSVTLSNLSANTKYSFKVLSKDSSQNQTFGSIGHFTTQLANSQQSGDAAQNSASANQSESQGSSQEQSGSSGTGSNIFEQLKDTVENKVVDYTIEKSLGENNLVNQTPGSEDQARNVSIGSTNPVVLVAGSVGINKLAGIFLIIFGIMSVVIAYLLYRLSRKVHRHIRHRLSGNEKGKRHPGNKK